MKRSKIASVAISALALSPLVAQAAGGPSSDGAMEKEIASAGPVRVLAGVRFWANQWDILYLDRELFLANPADPGSLASREVVKTATSSTKVVPIPFLGVRFGDFIGSASYFPETGFDSDGALSGDVDREELDVNFGYYITPSTVLSLGYRKGTQSKATDLIPRSEVRVKALLLGISFSAPISGPFSVYGNVAYGKAKLDTETVLSDGDDRLNGNYKIGEIGVSYNLSNLLGGSVLKGAALTFGYRTWVLTETDVPLGTFSLDNPLVPVSLQETEARTSTDGFVLGAVAVF